MIPHPPPAQRRLERLQNSSLNQKKLKKKQTKPPKKPLGWGFCHPFPLLFDRLCLVQAWWRQISEDLTQLFKVVRRKKAAFVRGFLKVSVLGRLEIAQKHPFSLDCVASSSELHHHPDVSRLMLRRKIRGTARNPGEGDAGWNWLGETCTSLCLYF